MANLNVDEVNKDAQHSESQHENNINGQENNYILQKEQELEEFSQNEDVATELKDRRNWNRPVHSSTFKKDTIINIGVSDTGSLAYHIGRKKSTLWPFSLKRLFTKHIKPHDDQRQKEHLYQGPKGLLKQRVIAVFQEYGYADYQSPNGEPLDYDPKTRNSFVRLVMFIVFVMLLVTSLFIAFVLETPDVKNVFRRAGMLILLPSLIGLMCCMYAMMCSPCSRIPPCNFVVLALVTIFMSLMAASISTRYRTEIILYAAISTCAIVLVCLGLACTSFDFTKWLLYVIVIGTAFTVVTTIVLIVMMVTNNYMKPVHLVILIISVLMQSVILVIDLQMILGGRSVELGEDDYALAAFMLYTSIMDIFLKMVQILGLLDD